MSEKQKFRVALVRTEEYDGESCKERILAIEETWAYSAKQAVNNVCFRHGGQKALAHEGGGSHVLFDEWRLAEDDDYVDKGKTIYDYSGGKR